MIEREVLVGGELPSKCSRGWEETAFGGDYESASRSEGTPYFNVGTKLSVVRKESTVPQRQGR